MALWAMREFTDRGRGHLGFFPFGKSTFRFFFSSDTKSSSPGIILFHDYLLLTYLLQFLGIESFAYLCGLHQKCLQLSSHGSPLVSLKNTVEFLFIVLASHQSTFVSLSGKSTSNPINHLANIDAA